MLLFFSSSPFQISPALSPPLSWHNMIDRVGSNIVSLITLMGSPRLDKGEEGGGGGLMWKCSIFIEKGYFQSTGGEGLQEVLHFMFQP